MTDAPNIPPAPEVVGGLDHAIPVAGEDRVASLNMYVDILVLSSKQTPYTWAEKVSCFLLAAVKVLGEEVPLKGRRGKVINAAVGEFHKKLQAHLPF
jgi:hypothetical protein